MIAQGGGIGFYLLRLFVLYALSPDTFTIGFRTHGLIVSKYLYFMVFSKFSKFSITGCGGGFLAPLLASSGSGQFVVLFSYYAIINSGIAYMSYYKPLCIFEFIGFCSNDSGSIFICRSFYDKSNWEKFQIFPIFLFLLYLIISIFLYS